MRLNRATVIYCIVITACLAGVWAVLSIGNGFVAPQDLAGKWTLESRLRSVSAAEAYGPGLSVDQSGRFFQVAFENGPHLNLRLDRQTESDLLGAHYVRLSLISEPWRMTFQGGQDGDEMEIRLVGPQLRDCGVWTARRIVKTFLPDVSQSAGAH